MASHPIGLTNNQSSRLRKDTKVAKKLKWTNINNFCAKKTYVWFTPLSKILVARLVAFTAADVEFSNDYEPQTKPDKKHCVPYKSFFRHEYSRFFKIVLNWKPCKI